MNFDRTDDYEIAARINSDATSLRSLIDTEMIIELVKSVLMRTFSILGEGEKELGVFIKEERIVSGNELPRYIMIPISTGR